MKNLTITTHSREDTMSLGKAIARSLGPGTGILLEGNLGTGKTTIISGIAQGLGVVGRVKSPTFVLVWLYESNVAPVYHIDLYRLGDYDELENIGWEEMTDESSIYLVEWADRFPLPYTEKAMRLSLAYGDESDDRKIVIDFDETLYPHLEKDVTEYAHPGN